VRAHPRPLLHTALTSARLPPCSPALFNKWCSDKGTYWLSKHNYGAAYEPLLAPRRWSTRNVLELGVGDETAGSLNTWREYFPLAHFWIVDIDVTRFADEPLFKWSTRQKRRHGCFDSATAHDTWHDAQVRHSGWSQSHSEWSQSHSGWSQSHSEWSQSHSEWSQSHREWSHSEWSHGEWSHSMQSHGEWSHSEWSHSK
jgi:hypothetical protein